MVSGAMSDMTTSNARKGPSNSWSVAVKMSPTITRVPATARGRGLRSIPTTVPCAPTARTAYCNHDPGQHPRSRTRSPGCNNRTRWSISSSL